MQRHAGKIKSIALLFISFFPENNFFSGSGIAAAFSNMKIEIKIEMLESNIDVDIRCYAWSTSWGSLISLIAFRDNLSAGLVLGSLLFAIFYLLAKTFKN